MAFLTRLLLLLVSTDLVAVEATTSCPSAAEVVRRIREMLRDTNPGQPVGRARVDRVGADIRITLRGPSGSPLAERTLDVKESCAELARATAVIIAVWEQDLRAGVPPPRTLPHPRPLVSRAALVSPAAKGEARASP